MAGPMMGAWGAAVAVAGAGLAAYAAVRGFRRRETRLEKKHRVRRKRMRHTERTRCKGLHDLRMIWAVFERGGEEALKAYVAKRRPSKRGRLGWIAKS